MEAACPSPTAGTLCALDLSAQEKAAIRYLSFLTLKPTTQPTSTKTVLRQPISYEVCVSRGERRVLFVVPVCAAVVVDIAELGRRRTRRVYAGRSAGRAGAPNRVIRCRL
ncbi:hypothetical protein ACNKHW_07485 [Shigella flexneri]